jgi:putative ABC transport system permease protein
MLRSYIKLAWKVLLRRKFFTFISLFGISFTLMILLVVVAFFDHLSGPQIPERKLDRMLFVSMLRQRYHGGHGWSNSPVSAQFVDKYVRTLKTPEQVALTSMTENATAFTASQRLTIDLRYTDGAFWNIMDFDFIEGRPFTEAEVNQSAAVAVMNESTARAYFGTTSGVVGRDLEMNLRRYRITGLVKDVPAVRLYSYSDVWAPYTLAPRMLEPGRLDGTFLAIILAKKPGDVQAIKDEFQRVVPRIPISNPKDIDHLYVYADDVLGSMTRQLLNSGNNTDPSDNTGKFFLLSTVLALLFMLLPTLNLVNLNVTRILERSSEIGVRKAFGASSWVLVGQFLVENIILSLLGGALGLGLAAGVLEILNDSHVIAYSHFGLNWRVFGWGIGLAVVFGLLSGVYPAWRMSRLNPVEALRGSGK